MPTPDHPPHRDRLTPCMTEEPETWFADTPDGVEFAKALCGTCPLRQACLDCLKWPAHIAVSVNLSVIDLRNGEIVAAVTDILAETGLDPSRLHLEVTASCLMEEAAKVQTMRIIRSPPG